MDNDKMRGNSFEASINGSDDESGMTLLGGEQTRNASHRRSNRTNLALKFLLGVLALTCASAVLYTAFAVHDISATTMRDYGDCGSSETVEEARAKGCIFDPMAWIWVRPECYDQKLVDDFMNRTDYSWHTNPKLTPESLVPLDVVFRGDHPKLFTQKKYHYVHCTVRHPTRRFSAVTFIQAKHLTNSVKVYVEEDAQGSVGEEPAY